MRTHRFIPAAVLAVICMCPQAAAASPSSTLLSGYGGPGQGNQAIIGSALIGGGGKGGGKGTGGGPSGPSAVASTTSIALPQAAKTSSHPRARAVRPKRNASRHAPQAPALAYERGTPASDRAAAGKTLGLTGADVVYGVLALGALALTSLLTVRLAGRSGRAEGPQ